MLAPPFGQPGPGTTDRAAVEALDRFDGGPTDQVVALLGDPSTVDRGVGLTVAGGHPGPGAQLLGPVKAGHVADLGHEHRAQHRPTPGMVWTHAAPPMQIYPDKLPAVILVHRASLVVVDVNSPSVARG